MPLFPSQEWMQAFCDELASHDEAPDLATALDGVYRFVVEPAGPLDEWRSYDVSIRPTGAGPKIAPLDADEGEEPRLTMTADYRRWQQLIRGEQDVGMAVMLRRLKVSGDLGGLMSQLASAQPLLSALGAVPTEWLDE
jgi:hypothetical protein